MPDAPPIAPALVDSLERISGLVYGFERRRVPPGAETRAQGRFRLQGELAEAGRLFFLRQVHGTTVCPAPWQGTPEADAGVATTQGLLLGIETADCLPALLVDPVRRFVGAAHAGWRGTAAGVVAELVRALCERGSEPGQLVAALGPAIGPCCYEVGEELREAFGPDAAGFFRLGPKGRLHLDVRAANEAQLRAAGVSSIAHVEECTSCRADLYHSYRRDGPGTGRMVSYVGFARS